MKLSNKICWKYSS